MARLRACPIAVCVLCGIHQPYRFIISRLNRSIKGNRALLLLLPEDVIHSVRVLRETMAALAKRLL